MDFNSDWFEHMEQILKEQAGLIKQEAEAMVENYWAQIRERKRAGENEGRLGVRLIDREGYKLQIVWYRKRWVGPKHAKQLYSQPIPKGRHRNKYPAQRFTGFTEWEQELVEIFEDDFARLREASGAVADQRKAMQRGKKAYIAMGYMSSTSDDVDETEFAEV